MKFNRKMYYDKVKACWTGKNIGGTMGAPYEGNTNMQNISGFGTPKGKPKPNDDLDLQLLWLCAVEECGIRNITPRTLGEYWLTYIPPHWNEYGVAKANLKLGLVPPLSGEYNNDRWKNSNGAWIRTEIWACLFPGFPELAVRYAYRDACVDHGHGEGTYAAMFVAALESMAFFEKDIRKLIDKALTFVPENCRLAESVKLAFELYDKGTPFADARNAVVECTSDLGWFQAPANVSFVILGLLYGDGDYKKSMILAINCGDDTDCTGATIGSIMGIIGGMEATPSDWVEYIGDEIVSMAVDLSYVWTAKSCTELTQRVAEVMPSAMKAYGMYTEYTDGETELDELPDNLRYVDFEIPPTGLSCDMPDMIFEKGRVEFSSLTAKCGEELKINFVFRNMNFEFRQLNVKRTLPEGWTADRKEANIYQRCAWERESTEALFTIVPNENIQAVNRLIADVSCIGRPTASIMPIVIFG